MKRMLFYLGLTLGCATAQAQKNIPTPKSPVLMPYNRSIQSAGQVFSYGDSAYENHALDVSLLAGSSLAAIEDRYGVSVFDMQAKKILDRWRFDASGYKGLMSTYSGIKMFRQQDSTFMVWSASRKEQDGARVMIAQWKNDRIELVRSLPIAAVAPATTALPNEVWIQEESGTPYLYVVLNGNNRLEKYNWHTLEKIWSAPTGVAPYGLCIVGQQAYVTNWGGTLPQAASPRTAGTPWGDAFINPQTGAISNGSLTIIDIGSGKPAGEIALGLHPSAIIASKDQQHLYITNGNSDYISVVRTAIQQVTDSIAVGLFSHAYKPYGSSPNALALDAAGNKLYVSNGMDNAIAVVQLGAKATTGATGPSQVLGYIPTEAYPAGLVVTDKQILVANIEGSGAHIFTQTGILKNDLGDAPKPSKGYNIHQQLASVSLIAVPGAKQLEAYTQQVKSLNLFYRQQLAALPPRSNRKPVPVPERIGEPSVFKHVVYIIKENKTYDQVLGDMPGGRGDSALTIFGRHITPNQHRLASDFVLLDNYYASGKSSAEGHQWTDASMVSDYIEKNMRAWFRSYPHRQYDAMVYNTPGFLWNHALDHGKSVRIYGEACFAEFDEQLNWTSIYNKYRNREPFAFRNTSTISRVRPILSQNYPGYDDPRINDQLRADAFISEWKAYEQMPGDSLPNLLIVALPNDHTAGTTPGFPTPRAMVADNDLALGRIIETITQSRFWDSTVVFATQDDTQGGWDHISPYRTLGQIISPYSRLGRTVSTHYNQTSLFRTIEQILGLPPMTAIDATALPMSDCFGSSRQPYRYQHLPNNIALDEMNKPYSALKGKALSYAKQSKEEAFEGVDNGKDEMMNRILWFDAKGDKPYPVLRKTGSKP